jgi:hypothetical protein
MHYAMPTLQAASHSALPSNMPEMAGQIALNTEMNSSHVQYQYL